jgi:hypothetical protein
MENMSKKKEKSIFEMLYELAVKKGEKGFEEPYSYRSDGGDFGSRREYTVYTYKDGHFTLVARRTEWKSWGPTSDKSGVDRELQIRKIIHYYPSSKTDKLLCSAIIDDWRDVESFTYPCSPGGIPSVNDERYLGKKSTPSSGWRVIKGKLPKKYEEQNGTFN